MLLKKVNKITELLQRDGGNVSFTELAEVLAEVLGGAEVYVISRSGKILGHSLKDGFPTTAFDASWVEEGRLSDEAGTALLKVGALSAAWRRSASSALVRRSSLRPSARAAASARCWLSATKASLTRTTGC